MKCDECNNPAEFRLHAELLDDDPSPDEPAFLDIYCCPEHFLARRSAERAAVNPDKVRWITFAVGDLGKESPRISNNISEAVRSFGVALGGE